MVLAKYNSIKLLVKWYWFELLRVILRIIKQFKIDNRLKRILFLIVKFDVFGMKV